MISTGYSSSARDLDRAARKDLNLERKRSKMVEQERKEKEAEKVERLAKQRELAKSLAATLRYRPSAWTLMGSRLEHWLIRSKMQAHCCDIFVETSWIYVYLCYRSGTEIVNIGVTHRTQWSSLKLQEYVKFNSCVPWLSRTFKAYMSCIIWT